VDSFDLTGRIAIVTGGNRGIGFGMARGLASRGASISVAGRDRLKSDQAVTELERLGVEAMAVEVDVTDEASLTAMVEATIERFGRIDILVNNAGMNIGGLPQDLATADWHKVMDTNLTSAFIGSRLVFPHMQHQGGGKVINTGSMKSIFGSLRGPAYAASKAGIVQLTKSLALAWAEHNIQVNAVLPGWIETDSSSRTRQETPGLYESTMARIPARRWGVVDDFGGVASFLASSASDYVTGIAIPVDGGYTSA
jgi:2-dehydro-3-deoxy-D-gluconate 5-dehydrogenase